MARFGWILLALLLVDPGMTGREARADELDDGGSIEIPPDETPFESPWPDGMPRQRLPEDAEREAIDLSLAEAMVLAIENNLDVQVARHDPLIAWERTRTAWGAYDPVARADATWADVETPVASALQAGNRTEDETIRSGIGLGGILPVLSTTYDIRFDGNRTKTDRTISTLRQQWESGLTFSITQPLLRNLYWNEPWTEVKISRQAYQQSLAEFRLALMDVVRGVEDAYWAAVASDEQERVAVKSLEAALELLEQTKVQYEVGVVSKVEVVEAEAGVAERDVELIRARNTYRAAQDRLIDLILGVNLTTGSTLVINPTDRPGEYTAYPVDAEEAGRKAMGLRPELASLDRAIQQQETRLVFNRNQLAPQIDLVASYGYKGLAGKPCDPPVGGSAIFGCTPTTSTLLGQRIDDSFGSSVEDYFDHDGAVNWSVGGVFSIPLGNQAPRARKRSAEVELRKIRTRRSRLVQDIVLEIRGAARDLKSAQEGIEAAERRRLAAEEQFRAEGIRLEQGESTPFDVLRRERDLVEAESQKIGAYQLYRNAVAALERAQGTILERHNIVVDQARRLR